MSERTVMESRINHSEEMVPDLKRRQSEGQEEQESKRQRVSLGKQSLESAIQLPDEAVTNINKDETLPAVETVPERAEQAERKNNVEASTTRRRPIAVDEKQRTRRLFGSLLGTLGSSGDMKSAKRRQEIETRRKAELKQQDEALAGDRQRRQSEAKDRRRREQSHVEEENMTIRHNNLKHSANYLQTSTLPKVYYRPWDLRPGEQRRITHQKEQVIDEIEREVKDFHQRRDESEELTHPRSAIAIPEELDATRLPESTKESTEPSQHPDTSSNEQATTSMDQREGSTTVVEPTQRTLSDHKDSDLEITKEPQLEESNVKQAPGDVEVNDQHLVEEDEHMVEGDEDNVIY